MTTLEDFSDVDKVVSDDLRFRLKLGIGEDAYASLRYGKVLQQLWDVGGFAFGGSAVAASSTVASMFSSGGLLGALGFAAGATPIGWVIAAGLVSGGAYYGVMRLAGRYGDRRVQKIPVFINSPVDLLAAGLVDMLGSLGIKVAAVDGEVSPDEIAAIHDYLVSEWGIDDQYAEQALSVIQENHSQLSIRDTAAGFGAFVRESEDCNEQAALAALMEMLREIALADGFIDEREEMAIEKIEATIRAEINLSLGRTAGQIGDSVSRTAGDVGQAVSDGSGVVTRTVSRTWKTLGQAGRNGWSIIARKRGSPE